MAEEKDETTEGGKWLTSEVLCQITGLTDRRHRQLASEGFIPPPRESKWRTVPTLQGLFKYYREAASKLREKVMTTRDVKAQKEVELLNIRIAKERGALIDRASVQQLLSTVAALQRARLYSALEQELPGRLEGRDAAQMRLVGRAVADELCSIFSDTRARWASDMKEPTDGRAEKH